MDTTVSVGAQTYDLHTDSFGTVPETQVRSNVSVGRLFASRVIMQIAENEHKIIKHSTKLIKCIKKVVTMDQKVIHNLVD